MSEQVWFTGLSERDFRAKCGITDGRVVSAKDHGVAVLRHLALQLAGQRVGFSVDMHGSSAYRDAMQQLKAQLISSQATMDYHRETWESNWRASQLRGFHGDINLQKDAHLGKSVAVLGAGASLDDGVGDHDIYLVCSHALCAAIHLGVQPTAVVVMDSSPVILDHFRGIDVFELALIAGQCVDPAIWSLPWGQTLGYETSCYGGIGAGPTSLWGGTSVSHTMAHIARYWGASEITLYGCDCALWQDRMHAYPHSERYGGDGCLWTVDVYGNPIRTMSIFVDFAYIWQEFALVKPEHEEKLINNSKGLWLFGWDHPGLQKPDEIWITKHKSERNYRKRARRKRKVA